MKLLKVVFASIALMLSISTYAKLDSKLYFIIQNNKIWHTDITELKTKCPQCRFALITNNMDKQEQKYLAPFDYIITTEKYDIPHLTQLIDTILEKEHPSEFDFLSYVENTYRLINALRKHYNTKLPKGEILDKFLNKITMKSWVSGKLPIPKYIHWDGMEFISGGKHYLHKIIKHVEGFPIIVKPIDAAGSYGTYKLHNMQEFQQWANKSKRVTNYEIDQFIDGDLYHVDSVIQDNKIIFAHASQYISSSIGAIIGDRYGSLMLPSDTLMAQQLLKFNQDVIRSLSPVHDTLTHLEIFKEYKTGRLYFLEIAARPAGALIHKKDLQTFGLDTYNAHLALQLGIFQMPNIPSDPVHSAYMWFPAREGTVTKRISPKIQSHNSLTWKIKIGDSLPDPLKKKVIVLEVILWDEDYQTLKTDFFDILGDPNYWPITVAN